MKKNIYLLFIILTALSATHKAQAYRWIFNNFTGRPVIVQIELLESKNPYFVLISPNQSGDFDWPPGNTMAGFCLGKIKYVTPLHSTFYNKILNQADLIDKKTMTIKDSWKMLAWLDKMADPTEAKKAGFSAPLKREEAQLRYLPDKLFNQTVKNAQELMGTAVGAKIVGWFANVVKESKCRGRDIYMIPEGIYIRFYTLAN